MKTAQGVAVRTRPAPSRGLLQEALFVGTLGGTMASLWFLLIDSLAGDPFLTPRTLAMVATGFDGEWAGELPELLLVAAYTFGHYAAFTVLGCVGILALIACDREPALLIFFLLLAEVVEVGFHGFVAILDEVDLLAGSEWLRFGGANLLAVGGVSWHLWYGYPRLRQAVGPALRE